MASLFQVVLIALAATSSMAEPARFRGNSRFFARQEEAPTSSPAPAPSPAAAAAAPYPAAGVTPSIPFELPNEQTTVQPDNTYLPPSSPAPTPDNTYGPPQDTYGPPAPPAQPDNQYGPPAAEEQIAEVDPRSQRIVFVQRNQRTPAKLRQQPSRTARIQLEPIEIIRSRPVIHYSVQYKSF